MSDQETYQQAPDTDMKKRIRVVDDAASQSSQKKSRPESSLTQSDAGAGAFTTMTAGGIDPTTRTSGQVLESGNDIDALKRVIEQQRHSLEQQAQLAEQHKKAAENALTSSQKNYDSLAYVLAQIELTLSDDPTKVSRRLEALRNNHILLANVFGLTGVPTDKSVEGLARRKPILEQRIKALRDAEARLGTVVQSEKQIDNFLCEKGIGVGDGPNRLRQKLDKLGGLVQQKETKENMLIEIFRMLGLAADVAEQAIDRARPQYVRPIKDISANRRVLKFLLEALGLEYPSGEVREADLHRTINGFFASRQYYSPADGRLFSTAEIAAAQMQLQELQSTAQNYKTQYEEQLRMNKAIQECGTSLEQAERNAILFEKRLNESEAKLASTNQELANTRGQLEQTSNSLQSERASHDATNQKLQEAEVRAKAYKVKYEKEESKAEKLQDDLNNQSYTINAWRNARTEEQAKAQEVENRTAELKASLAEANGRIQEKESLAAKLEESESENAARILELEKKANEQEQKAKEVERMTAREIADAEHAKEAAEAKQQEAMHELVMAQAKQPADEELNTLRDELRRIKLKLSRSEQAVIELENDSEQQRVENENEGSELKAELANKKKTVTQVEADFKEAKTAWRTANDELKTYKEKVDTLMQRCEKLMEERVHNIQRLDEYEIEKARQSTEREDIDEQLKAKQAQLATYRTELQNVEHMFIPAVKLMADQMKLLAADVKESFQKKGNGITEVDPAFNTIPRTSHSKARILEPSTENERLNKEMKELKQTVGDVSSVNEDLTKEINSGREENQQHEQDTVTQAKEAQAAAEKALMEKNAQHSEQIHGLKLIKGQLETKIGELQLKARKHVNDVNELTLAKIRISDEKKASEKVLRDDIHRLNITLHQEHSARQKAVQDSTQLEVGREALEEQIEQLTVTIEAQDKKLRKDARTISDLVGDLETAKRSNESMQTNQEALEQQIKERTTVSEAQAKELESNKATITHLSASIKVEKGRAASLDVIINKSNEKIRESDAAIIHMQAQISELEALLQERAEELNSSTTQVQSLEAAVEENEATILRLQARKSELEEHLEDTMKQIAALQAEAGKSSNHRESATKPQDRSDDALSADGITVPVGPTKLCSASGDLLHTSKSVLEALEEYGYGPIDALSSPIIVEDRKPAAKESAPAVQGPEPDIVDPRPDVIGSGSTIIGTEHWSSCFAYITFTARIFVWGLFYAVWMVADPLHGGLSLEVNARYVKSLMDGEAIDDQATTAATSYPPADTMEFGEIEPFIFYEGLTLSTFFHRYLDSLKVLFVLLLALVILSLPILPDIFGFGLAQDAMDVGGDFARRVQISMRQGGGSGLKRPSWLWDDPLLPPMPGLYSL